jgi:UDP-2,3-diacylglucosamine hydrolase
MRALFISDLHLNERDAMTDARFNAFITGPAHGADRLYIIGDLFHVWLGDAMMPSDAYALTIIAKIRTLAESGTQVFVARGNRDFMIGEQFARACGATLLDQQTVITLNDQRALLLHGDELCTDDIAFQRARRILRTDLFRKIGNSLPTSWRHAIARTLRSKSDAHKAVTSLNIMDANPQAIERMFTKHNVPVMIHGHTHRPGEHVHANSRRRIVLSDWQQDFGFLEWLDGEFHVRGWGVKFALTQ